MLFDSAPLPVLQTFSLRPRRHDAPWYRAIGTLATNLNRTYHGRARQTNHAAKERAGVKERDISKLEAAGRQLDTAIKLFFDNDDSLSIHTLAHASFKILFDIYPAHSNDDFASKLDEMVRQIGWKRFNQTANFLKHADRDPSEMLRYHDAESAETLIGLATILYRRIAGDFTPLMRGFDCWTEALHPEALGIPADPDSEREASEKAIREAIKSGPLADRLRMGKQLTEMLQQLWEQQQGLAEDDSPSNLAQEAQPL